MSPTTVESLQRQIVTMRRWVCALAVAVALLALLALRAIDPATAQPAPAPKSLVFVDGDKQVELDANGLRVTRPNAQLAIAADKISIVAGSTVELAASAVEAHVKALSDLGSSSLVANPKSLCVAIRQIGGKDSYTCIPPVK